jgi:hypothetical protein
MKELRSNKWITCGVALGISTHPKGNVPRVTALEEILDRRHLADSRLLNQYVSECLNGRFRRKPTFELAKFAHCLYRRVSTTTVNQLLHDALHSGRSPTVAAASS